MSRTARSKSQRLHFTPTDFSDGDLSALRAIRATRAAVQGAARAARRGDRPASPVPPDAVPIRVEAPSPFVHFPATADDLRAILRELPPGACDGLRAVEVSAAAEYPAFPGDPATSYLDHHLDPWKGRRGLQSVLPGVFGRPTDWDYSASTATAYVYGFVYEAPLRHRAVTALFLRHRMLAGLAKAVAFHQESAGRLARGRRMPHARERTGRRSRALADAWIRGVVTPYVRRAWPAEVAEFEAWTLAHGGVALPLHVLETFDDDLMPGVAVMGGMDTLGALLRDVDAGSGAPSTRRTLAFWLHYDGHFDLALAALDRLLADAPADADGRALRAHVLLHLGRTAEAVAALRVLVQDAPRHQGAWAWLAEGLAALGEETEGRDAKARAMELRRATDQGDLRDDGSGSGLDRSGGGS